MEGIVAKRIDAPYRSGHVQSSIKVKCERRLALPISISADRKAAR